MGLLLLKDAFADKVVVQENEIGLYVKLKTLLVVSCCDFGGDKTQPINSTRWQCLPKLLLTESFNLDLKPIGLCLSAPNSGTEPGFGGSRVMHTST